MGASTVITAATIGVTRLVDPSTDATGHAVDSLYVEQFWLPTLGPTSTWLARRLVQLHKETAHNSTVMMIDLVDLATDIGTKHTPGSSRGIGRHIARLTDFGMAQRVDRETLAVRYFFPDLPGNLARRLTRSTRTRLAHHLTETN